MRPRSILALLGPGLLVAATGVGAGDLATAGFAGMKLGTAVLWAVALGAFLKFVLNEGLARWQLATGRTVLEGALGDLGAPVRILFILYFLPWSFFTGAALISACGVTSEAMLEPLGLWPADVSGKLWLGAAHSALGVGLVLAGGYKLIERTMAACIAVMFVTVLATAILLRPDVGAITRGLFVPTIPDFDGEGFAWTLALLGGVGGTLTVICYGYWIREEGRTGLAALRTCRIDLAVAYVLTALFGMAMLVIATGLEASGGGVRLIVDLGHALERTLGPVGRWMFLIGAWAAVFSSLLGVWQAVPYVFADTLHIVRRRPGTLEPNGRAYRVFLILLAIIPIIQVSRPFGEVQKYYAVLGAAFIPMLALALLLLNRRAKVGTAANRPTTVGVLVLALLLFLLAGGYQVRKRFQPASPAVVAPAVAPTEDRAPAGATMPVR